MQGERMDEYRGLILSGQVGHVYVFYTYPKYVYYKQEEIPTKKDKYPDLEPESRATNQYLDPGREWLSARKTASAPDSQQRHLEQAKHIHHQSSGAYCRPKRGKICKKNRNFILDFENICQLLPRVLGFGFT
jgi:hypothetical protein